MEFTSLLGLHLKSDEMLDILELHDVDVVYDFDRLHEGTRDIYWAAFKRECLLLRFNDMQLCDVVFLYLAGMEGFQPVSRNEIDVDLYEDRDTAAVAFRKNGTPFTAGDVDDLHWIKGDLEDYTLHYEFRDRVIERVTISSKDAP